MQRNNASVVPCNVEVLHTQEMVSHEILEIINVGGVVEMEQACLPNASYKQKVQIPKQANLCLHNCWMSVD